jgi:cinnamyl-alcohol dehydrogenase
MMWLRRKFGLRESCTEVNCRCRCLFCFLGPSQIGAADGEPDANTLGWAARDSTAVLSPYKFKRRALGPNDVYIKITHAGMCHSDLHAINGDWDSLVFLAAKYPVVPG